MTYLKITEEMREAARALAQAHPWPGKISWPDLKTLNAMANGKRKLIDARWWQDIHEVVDQAKLDKLQRLADPARNPFEHERAVAKHKLAEFKARKPPGLRERPEARPLPSTIEEWDRMRKPLKTRPAPKRRLRSIQLGSRAPLPRVERRGGAQ